MVVPLDSWGKKYATFHGDSDFIIKINSILNNCRMTLPIKPFAFLDPFMGIYKVGSRLGIPWVCPFNRNRSGGVFYP
jgi:hypothetical protein